MRAADVLRWRMPRLPFALLALAPALIGQVSISAAQTKFEGSYKGTIVLDSAQAIWSNTGQYCDASPKNFEQVMTISGDRVYLERKGSQQSVLFSGTVTSEGSISASGLQKIEGANQVVSLVFSFTGKIDSNEFSGSMTSRTCGYSVKLKK